MHVFLTRRPEGGTGIVSAIFAWEMATLTILGELRSDLDPLQYRMASDIIGLWSRVVPQTLGPDADHRVVTEETVSSVQQLFDDADSLASVVHIFRTVMPHQAENRERDEALYREAKMFCSATADAIAEHRFQGCFVIEGWLFLRLIEHLRNLLRIVLGDVHQARFAERYDAAMGELAEQVMLNERQPN